MEYKNEETDTTNKDEEKEEKNEKEKEKDKEKDKGVEPGTEVEVEVEVEVENVGVTDVKEVRKVRDLGLQALASIINSKV